MQTVAVATSILLELLQARAVQDANDTRQQVGPPVVVWYIKGFHGNTTGGSVVYQGFHGNTSSDIAIHQW